MRRCPFFRQDGDALDVSVRLMPYEEWCDGDCKGPTLPADAARYDQHTVLLSVGGLRSMDGGCFRCGYERSARWARESGALGALYWSHGAHGHEWGVFRTHAAADAARALTPSVVAYEIDKRVAQAVSDLWQ